jgi:hypothetical protein
MTDNIISMPAPMNVLADRIRALMALVETNDREWIELTIELGLRLAEARSRFSSDIQFSVWLAENELDSDRLGHQTRAALIGMGQNIELTKTVLSETSSRSWRLIWENEIKPRVTSVGKPIRAGTSSEISLETIKRSEQTNETPDPTPEESDTNVEPDLPRATPKHSGTGKAWALAKHPDADLVYAHIMRVQSRSALATIVSKRGGRAIWDLLVEAIKLGYYGPPSAGNERANLRMILPWVLPGRHAESINLKNDADRRYVRDIIFPALADHPELQDHPGDFDKVVAQRKHKIEQKLRDTRQMEHHAEVVAKHQFQLGEQEVIAYGTPIWPRDRDPGYTYEELKHACWYANFFLSSIAHRDWAVESTGMMGRHLIKWLGPVAPGTVKAIKEIFSLYELNPNGECKFPMTPVNFGIV